MDDDIRSQLDDLKVRTQSDLHRLWQLLMQPLGFRTTSVWVTFIGADARPIRFLIEIAESEQLPEPEEVARLFELLEEVCVQECEGASVAFLVTRPGRDGVNSCDRALAGRLLMGAQRSRLTCHPVHVANDVAVWAVAPDDLAA